MASPDVEVKVVGLVELRKALKQVSTELPKEMKTGFKAIAQSIASGAQDKMPSISGKAKGSIKPRASASGASIVFGGSAAPYEPFLDFGGKVGRNKSVVRPFIKEGRYLYPTIKEKNTEIMEAVDKLITKVAESAGFDIH